MFSLYQYQDRDIDRHLNLNLRLGYQTSRTTSRFLNATPANRTYTTLPLLVFMYNKGLEIFLTLQQKLETQLQIT